MIGDQKYIEKTFRLAKRGQGAVSPNPLVGAVLVKSGNIIGEGFHEYFGGPHAEVNAIHYAVESARGATLYCNLEPCCHTQKKTPPCVDLILERKIARVVVSNLDPNPLVSGRGMEKLRQQGVEVEWGILEEQGRELNEVFFKFITTGRPFVHIKMAQTLDGKLCTEEGNSQWISGEKSRKRAHLLRKQYDAVLVGRKTFNKDNPRLTCREGKVHRDGQPRRIVVGNPEKMHLGSHLFNDEYEDKTLIASTVKLGSLSSRVKTSLKEIEMIETAKRDDPRFWENLWEQLATKNIASILVEGGPATIHSILQEKQWDKMTSFISPKILGNGPDFYHSSVQEIGQAISLQRVAFKDNHVDMCVSGYREEERCLRG